LVGWLVIRTKVFQHRKLNSTSVVTASEVSRSCCRCFQRYVECGYICWCGFRTNIFYYSFSWFKRC